MYRNSKLLSPRYPKAPQRSGSPESAQKQKKNKGLNALKDYNRSNQKQKMDLQKTQNPESDMKSPAESDFGTKSLNATQRSGRQSERYQAARKALEMQEQQMIMSGDEKQNIRIEDQLEQDQGGEEGKAGTDHQDEPIDSMILNVSNKEQLKQKPQIVNEEIKQKMTKEQRRVKNRNSNLNQTQKQPEKEQQVNIYYVKEQQKQNRQTQEFKVKSNSPSKDTKQKQKSSAQGQPINTKEIKDISHLSNSIKMESLVQPDENLQPLVPEASPPRGIHQNEEDQPIEARYLENQKNESHISAGDPSNPSKQSFMENEAAVQEEVTTSKKVPPTLQIDEEKSLSIQQALGYQNSNGQIPTRNPGSQEQSGQNTNNQLEKTQSQDEAIDTGNYEQTYAETNPSVIKGNYYSPLERTMKPQTTQQAEKLNYNRIELRSQNSNRSTSSQRRWMSQNAFVDMRASPKISVQKKVQPQHVKSKYMNYHTERQKAQQEEEQMRAASAEEYDSSLPKSYARLSNLQLRSNQGSVTRHNFKKDFSQGMQPQWNGYIGQQTFARTEDQYKKELQERKQKRNLQIKHTLRSQRKSRPVSRDYSQDVSINSPKDLMPTHVITDIPINTRGQFQNQNQSRSYSRNEIDIKNETGISQSQQTDNLSQTHQKKLNELQKKYSVTRSNTQRGQIAYNTAQQEIKSIKVENLFQSSQQNFMQGTSIDKKIAFKPFNPSLLSGSQTTRNTQPKPLRFQPLHNQVHIKSSLTNEQVIEPVLNQKDSYRGRFLKNKSQFSSKVNNNLQKLKEIKDQPGFEKTPSRPKSRPRSSSRMSYNNIMRRQSSSQQAFMTPAQMARNQAINKPGNFELSGTQKTRSIIRKELLLSNRKTSKIESAKKLRESQSKEKPPQFGQSAEFEEVQVDEQSPPITRYYKNQQLSSARKQRKTWQRPSETIQVEEIENIHDHYLLSFNKKTYQKDSKVQSLISLVENNEEPDKQKDQISVMGPKNNDSNPILKSNRDQKINFFNSIPSVQRDSENLRDYALRNSLNQMEPQMQKFKLRKDLQSNYQKQRESTFVALMTTSIYGDPKLFDLQKLVQKKITNNKRVWKSPFSNLKSQIEDKHADSFGDMIHIFILEYLEGFNPVGPSIHIFKLAMMNKKMMAIIKNIYNIQDFKEFQKFDARQKMIDVFLTEPNYDKYVQNTRALRNVKGAWSNKVFGGSVFRPIKAAITGIGSLKERRIDGKKIEKKNQLRKIIEEIELDPYNGGGFYTLKNVKASNNTFLDIEILILGAIKGGKDQQLLDKLQTISHKKRKMLPTPNLSEKLIAPVNKQYKYSRMFSPPQSKVDKVVKKTLTKKETQEIIKEQKKLVTLAQTPNLWTQGLRFASPDQAHRASKRQPAQYEPKMVLDKPRKMKRSQTNAQLIDPNDFFISKEDLKHMLNGFARVIEFGTNHIDKRGNYNPTVDPSQNFIISMGEGQFRNGLFHGFSRSHDSEGECKIGYWRIEENKDKVQVSRPYGKFAHYYKDGSFKTPDGLYHGNDKYWNRLIKQQMIHDYIQNQKPE